MRVRVKQCWVSGDKVGWCGLELCNTDGAELENVW